MRFAGSAVTSKKSNTKNCFPLYNNINNQGLIQEINLGGDSRPNNFLSMELGAWEAFWVPQIGAANDIWSYVRLRICLILMYLLVKICKSLCFTWSFWGFHSPIYRETDRYFRFAAITTIFAFIAKMIFVKFEQGWYVFIVISFQILTKDFLKLSIFVKDSHH